MINEDYKPRFVFEVSMEQKRRADAILDAYGQRKAIFGPILDDVLDLIEDYGGVAIGIIISGKAKPRDIIPIMSKANKIGRRMKEDD